MNSLRNFCIHKLPVRHTGVVKRPVAVILIASLYLLVGVAGFIGHFPELLARHPDALAMELTELAAVLCGVFLLRRHNWARWLALAWILFHVAISLTDPFSKLAIHIAFAVFIAWALFRPQSGRWFRPTATAA